MTSLSQRLSALHAERGHLVGNYEATLQPSLDENRDLSDIETEALGAVQERIETVDRQIEWLTAAEALLARQAQPAQYSYPGDRPGTAVVLRTQRDRPHIEMRRRDQYKGADFTRFAIAVSVAGQWNAAEYARQRWGDDEFADAIQRALWLTRAPVPPIGSIDGSGLGNQSALVRLEHLGAEFIEMLRPLLIVARMPNMRRLEFDAAGSLLIPRQTSGVAGGYVGEGGIITVNALAFGQLQLVPSKLAVIVPTTNELLHRADPGIEQLIRDDMLQGTARTVDQFFFSERAAGASPAGILFGRTALADSEIPEHDDTPGHNNVSIVTEALKAMILALRMQNVPMLAPVWIMNARTKEYLRLLRTTQEIFAFKAEIDAGTLLGYPVIDTTNIRIPWWGEAAASVRTVYALIDASQLIWAEDMLPMIDASEHASIWSDSGTLDTGQPPNPVLPPGQLPPPAPPQPAPGNTPFWSAFQNDLVLMRIRMRHTWARRHDVAVAWAYTSE
jgi:hypothetical protein